MVYNGRIKRIPERSMYSKNIDFALGLSTLYYGMCYIEQEYVTGNNSFNKDEPYWIFRILNRKNRELLLSIKVTEMVKYYIDYDFNKPDKLYNIAFVLELYRKKDFYTGSLRNSRYFKFVPVE